MAKLPDEVLLAREVLQTFMDFTIIVIILMVNHDNTWAISDLIVVNIMVAYII